MATVGQIRAWLVHVPDEAEFVVWAYDGKEYPVVRVGHTFEPDHKAGVFTTYPRPAAIITFPSE